MEQETQPEIIHGKILKYFAMNCLIYIDPEMGDKEGHRSRVEETHRLGEGHAGDGPVEDPHAQDMQGVEADGVPHAHVGVEHLAGRARRRDMFQN